MDNRRSFRTSAFKAQVQRLPSSVQDDVTDSFKLWKEGQPVVGWQSLNCAGGKVWSARINYRHRALATELPMPDGSVCWMWFWAGTREEYETVIKSSSLQAAQRHAVDTYRLKFAQQAKRTRRARRAPTLVQASATTVSESFSAQPTHRSPARATTHSSRLHV